VTGHGGDVVSMGRALGIDPRTMLDLSASLNPLAPDVTTLATPLLGHLRRYVDDVEVADGTARLADAIGVDAERTLLTNGASEAIALVARQQPNGWVEPPEFSLYEQHLETLSPEAPRWRSNPNNPFGTLASADERAGVWDESFFPLATGTWTRGDDDAYRIGSLTKLWACPGLRLGYVIAPSPAAAGALAVHQPAWSVNGLALALLAPLLERTDLPAWATGISVLRREVARLFTGFAVVESTANWVLVHGAGHLRTPLARRGVLVRDCTSFGLPGTIRVAVPSEAGLDRLAASLAAVGS
jgi:histidinol-phosphate/aromatic aminotransferase/cobyric acid decarboxylase-like protein